MANLLPTVDMVQHRNSRLRYTDGKYVYGMCVVFIFNFVLVSL